MTSDAETRLKRLKIRSWRRGIREMDMILGPFCDACAASLNARTLGDFEAMLEENDHDLYQWISGQATPPEHFRSLIGRIRDHKIGA